MMIIVMRLLVIATGLVLAACSSKSDDSIEKVSSAANAESSLPITVYSSRAEHLIQPPSMPLQKKRVQKLGLSPTVKRL